MANTPQSPNNGKSYSGEKAPNAANLNMSLPSPPPSPPPPMIHGQGVASSATMDKGKEVMVEVSQSPPNTNKRKSIVLGGPAHHPNISDDEHVPKIPRTNGLAAQDEEGGDENIPPSLRQENRETIVNPLRVNHNVPQAYICDFCNKRFPSPQALGGHQNGHKLERQMRSEIEAMNKAMEQQTFPSLMAFTGTYGPSFTPMTMTNQYLPSGYGYGYSYNNNPVMMMGYGNPHQQQNGVPINGTFQNGVGTTPGLDVNVATAGGANITPHGNNTNTALFYPQWALGDGNSIWNNGTGINYLNPGYETGYYNNAGGYYGNYGALDSGYGGAIYHPQGSFYNYPEFETGYYNGGVGGAGGGTSYYGAFQQPNPAWINLIPSTGGYYVGIDNNNNYCLYLAGQVDAAAMAYDPLQQQGGVTLSMNDHLPYQNTGTTQQQVPMVAMDFGSVPAEEDEEEEGEAGHGGPDENIEDEDEEEEEGGGSIDLTLRL